MFFMGYQGCFCNVIIGPTHKIFFLLLLCEIILKTSIRTSEAKKIGKISTSSLSQNLDVLIKKSVFKGENVIIRYIKKINKLQRI